MSVNFQAFTEAVIQSIGKDAHPRIKETFPILIRKLHEFCIEADVTVEEWMATCNLFVQAGQISSPARNEVVLMSDVLGIESLVDTLAHVRAAKDNASDKATHSAILGPFYRQGVQVQPNDTSIVRQDEPEGDYTYLSGRVFGHDGKPLAGVPLDIWHDAPDGLYDAQSPEKPEFHCRGRFETDSEGRYSLVCLRPEPYPIPFDNAAGHMLKLMDRHPFRPAHIHYLASYPGQRTLVTQVYDRKSKYLDNDSVFAVKDNLIVDFLPLGDEKLPENLPDADKIKFRVKYDIHLAAATDDSVDIDGAVGAEAGLLTNGTH